MSILEHSMNLHIRFWMEELPLRFRGWWHRHWWPSRIKQLDQERRYWRGKFYPPEDECSTCKGSGWHPDRIARAGNPSTDPCPDCGGSGITEDEKRWGAGPGLDPLTAYEQDEG